MVKRGLAGALLVLGLGVPSCQAPSAPAASSASPRRLVSLIPSATELIYEVGAGSALVGVTVNDAYPPEVAKLPKVGDQTIDSEKLLTLAPDLVVLDSEFNKDGPKLERLGLSILSLKSGRLTDIPKNLRLLGERLGHPEEGEAAAGRFEKSLQSTPMIAGKPRVFVEIWGSPLMTVGSDSLPNDLLEHLGLVNVYEDQKGYFQVDPEDVVSRRPAVVIFPSTDSKDDSTAARLLRKAGIPVRVIVIRGAHFTNPTPRVLSGLEQLLQELGKTSR